MPSTRLFVRDLLVVSTLLAGTALAGLSIAQPNERDHHSRAMPRGEHHGERPRPIPGHRPGPMLRNVDTNGDGLISQEEFTTPRTKRYEKGFEHRDQDADGLLSREELQPRRHQPRPAIDAAALRACVVANGGNALAPVEDTDEFATADSDGDSFLNKEEFFLLLEQRAFALFNRLDTDGDGHLTTDELSAGKEDRKIQGSIVRECMQAQRDTDL